MILRLGLCHYQSTTLKLYKTPRLAVHLILLCLVLVAPNLRKESFLACRSKTFVDASVETKFDDPKSLPDVIDNMKHKMDEEQLAALEEAWERAIAAVESQTQGAAPQIETQDPEEEERSSSDDDSDSHPPFPSQDVLQASNQEEGNIKSNRKRKAIDITTITTTQE